MSIEGPQPGIFVPALEVHAEFIEMHSQDEEFNRYGLFNIHTATEAFGETWVRRELGREEVLSAVMPSHQHPAGEGAELVPWGGMTVEQAAERLKKLRDYEATNSACFTRLQFLQESTSPVYLSTKPLPTDYYQQLKLFTGERHLYHLDGLHRLVGRAAAGLLSLKDMDQHPVVAYIAGEA